MRKQINNVRQRTQHTKFRWSRAIDIYKWRTAVCVNVLHFVGLQVDLVAFFFARSVSFELYNFVQVIVIASEHRQAYSKCAFCKCNQNHVKLSWAAQMNNQLLFNECLTTIVHLSAEHILPIVFEICFHLIWSELQITRGSNCNESKLYSAFEWVDFPLFD